MPVKRKAGHKQQLCAGQAVNTVHEIEQIGQPDQGQKSEDKQNRLIKNREEAKIERGDFTQPE